MVLNWQLGVRLLQVFWADKILSLLPILNSTRTGGTLAVFRFSIQLIQLILPGRYQQDAGCCETYHLLPRPISEVVMEYEGL